MPNAESPYSPIGEMVAAASVSAVGAVVGAKYGVVSTGLAANVFTITLKNPIDSANAGVMVTARSATAAVFAIGRLSDSTVEVRGFNAAGAAADVAFDICVFRKALS